MQNKIIEKISSLFDSGEISRAILWKNGEFSYDKTPYTIESKDGLKDFSYDEFAGGSLVKYLIEESKKEGKVLVILKPCDMYAFNRLKAEHRINADNVYILGVHCEGKADISKIRNLGIKGIVGIKRNGDTFIVETLYGNKEVKCDDILMEKCYFCKKSTFDDGIDTVGDAKKLSFTRPDDFSDVLEIEKMSADERFNFWRNELSKCIRCNACRNVCPVCNCEKCVFDNDDSKISSKAPAGDFEENMFHIIRAFHVAGRCTDCRECSRVCPENIPLYLLNRKFIKDINELYGEFQSGETLENRSPLTSYTEKDEEPSWVYERKDGE